MILRGATSLWGALEGVGLENRDFFGPWNGTSEASAIWAQKSREKAEHTHKKLTRALSIRIRYVCILYIAQHAQETE